MEIGRRADEAGTNPARAATDAALLIVGCLATTGLLAQFEQMFASGTPPEQLDTADDPPGPVYDQLALIEELPSSSQAA